MYLFTTWMVLCLGGVFAALASYLFCWIFSYFRVGCLFLCQICTKRMVGKLAFILCFGVVLWVRFLGCIFAFVDAYYVFFILVWCGEFVGCYE